VEKSTIYDPHGVIVSNTILTMTNYGDIEKYTKYYPYGNINFVSTFVDSRYDSVKQTNYYADDNHNSFIESKSQTYDETGIPNTGTITSNIEINM